MCLVAFAIGASPHWPLVIASNRDEYLDRPTLPLTRWTTATGHDVISGRDLLAGGTWLGASPGGRVAFLTNVRGDGLAPSPALRSRGGLVTRWLEASCNAASFAENLKPDASHYGGFNLVVGDFQRNDWMWVTNRDGVAGPPGWRMQALQPGVYGLSNAALDTPWPKTVELKRALHTALAAQSDAADPDSLQTLLWQALASRVRILGSRSPVTSSALEPVREEAFSSAFVEFPEKGYGTRNSTLVLVKPARLDSDLSQYQMLITERTYFHDLLFKPVLSDLDTEILLVFN